MPVETITHKVNHVALVIDRSGSMKHQEQQLLKVADGFVAGLKQTSDDLGHETRISVYAFDHQVACLVWDMDVKHLPSLAGKYTVDNGATALLEAAVISLDDLENEVSQKYGDHLFLHVGLTDGGENASGASALGFAHHNRIMHRHIVEEWKQKLADRLDRAGRRTGRNGKRNWTCGIMVPSLAAKQTAVEYGFHPGNTEIWNPDSATGIEEAIGSVQTAAANLLRSHDQGVSSTTNLFAVGQDLDVATVASTLTPLDGRAYKFLDVDQRDHEKEIRPFVQARMPKVSYRPGMAYYQLGPRVTVQASKDVVVYDTKDKLVFGGPDARELLFGAEGRAGGSISVKAGHNPRFKVFVQSKSVNRKVRYLGKDTKVLVML